MKKNKQNIPPPIPSLREVLQNLESNKRNKYEIYELDVEAYNDQK